MNLHHANTFAYRLKIARQAKKLSQKQLGILAGVDESSASARMNQYERGKHLPDFLMMSKIAECLDLPVAYFFANNDELAEAIILFAKLSKENQAYMLSFLANIENNP